MSLNPSYAPNDTSTEYWSEVTHLNGQTVLSGFSFGILFTLYVLCMDAFLPQFKKPAHRKSALFNIVYTTTILILVGTGTASNARLTQIIWIENRNYPGGPAKFLEQEQNYSVYVWGWAMYVIASWLQDAYVIYRCLVFWDWSIWVFTLPVILLASVGTSIALLIETGNSSEGVFGPLTLDLAICWYIFSVSVNVFATIAIVGRLLWKRRAINAILGKEHSKSYTGVVAMLIESAAMYSILGLIFIGCYFRQNPAGDLILPFLGNLEGISPMMIIYRVAVGRGWSHKTLRHVNSTFAITTLHFNGPTSTTMESSNVTTGLAHYSTKATTSSGDVKDGPVMGKELPPGIAQDVVIADKGPDGCAEAV